MATKLIHMPSVLFVAIFCLALAGCEGDDGNNGAAGADGISCWDLNENGVGDPEEDLNGDGVVDVLDCREPLPGGTATVMGTVSSTTGTLDSNTSLFFAPTAVMAAKPDLRFAASSHIPEGAIEADVEDDGTYTVDLEPGTYDVFASRPGYEEFMQEGYEVGGDDTLDIALVEVPDGEYITSEDCGVCHTSTYDSFVQTGHPYKLNKSEGNQQPQYPFTNLDGVLERIMGADNTLGAPMSYDNVSYVIGGFHWKARFMDGDGFIVTGDEVQYNFIDDSMTAYNAGTVDKPYNCGNCHTTGWQHTDDTLNPNRQDDLPGMDGTFAMTGIQCEACHGAGAAHAKGTGGITRNALARTLVELTAPDAGYGLPIACGECHTRDGERDYSTYISSFDQALIDASAPDPRPDEMGGRIKAKGGFEQHHEQYDEALGIDPDTLASVRSPGFIGAHVDCGTCHNPHGSAIKQTEPTYTGEMGVDLTKGRCLDCHPNYDPALLPSSMSALNCQDCHMPDLPKSARSTPPEGEGPELGDVATHIFKIVLDSTLPQFTADDAYAYPRINTDYACRVCHNGVDVFPVTDGLADSYMFHTNVTN